MGRKKLSKPVIDENFTTLAASPLGQLLNHIHDSLNALIVENEKKKEQPTLDKSYATQRLEELRELFDKSQNLLKYYNEGKEPSGFSFLPFCKNAIGFYIQLHDAQGFDTPAYVFYKLVQKKLPQLIESCEVKQFDPSNISSFKENLKAKLKKQNYEEAKQIPGCNLEQYFLTVDRAIDGFYIENDSAFDSTVLANEIVDEINSALYEKFYYKDLIISHPSMYTLIIEIMDLLEQLPDELKAVVTFLNPKAFNIDIKNSLAASVIPERFAYLKVTVKHTPQSAPVLIEGQASEDSIAGSASEFCYEVTDSNEAKIFFSLDEVFRGVMVGVKTILSRALDDYFRNYAETAHVKSEIAKAELLQEFTKKEKEGAKRVIAKAIQLEESFEEFNVFFKKLSRSDKKVDVLEKQTKVLDESIKELAELLLRNQDYELQNVATLFSSHVELSLDLQQSVKTGVDTSYIAEQLPETIVARNQFGQFVVMPIKIALSMEPAKYREIKQLLNSLEEKRKELINKQEQEAQSWQHEVLSFHEANNEQFDKSFSDYIEWASHLLSVFEDNFDKFGTDTKLEAIAEQLAFVFESLAKARDYLNSVRMLEEQMHASITKTALASELLFKIEPTTAAKIQISYQSSKNKIEQLHILMQNKIAALESRQKALDIQFNKAKAAKELYEIMKSADPALIVELKESKITELAALTKASKNQSDILLIKENQKEELVKSQLEIKAELTSAQLDLSGQQIKCTTKCIELMETLKLITDKDPETILSNEKLVTPQGIKEAFAYLNALMIETKQQLNELEDERFSNDKLAALITAKEFIYNTKGKIKFSTLDKKINMIFNRKDGKGFDFLLDLMQSKYHTKERWAGHRSRKGNELAVIEDTNTLLEMLASHIQTCEIQKTDRPKLLAFQEKKKELLSLLNLIRVMEIYVQNVEKLIEKQEQSEKNKSELTSEIEFLNRKLIKCKEEVDALTKDTNILDKIIQLLNGHQELSKEIADLVNRASDLDVEGLNLIQDPLIEGINSVGLKLQQLEELSKYAEVEALDLADTAAYQNNFGKIRELASDSKQKIDRFIADLCHKKFNDLKEQIAKGKEGLEAISLEQTKITEEIPTQANQLLRLNNWLKLSVNLVQSVGASLPKIRLIETDLQQLADAQLKTEIQSTIGELKQLDRDCQDRYSQCLEAINSLLKEILLELKQNKAKAQLKFDETQASWELNSATLSEIDSYLKTIPIVQLELLKSSLGDLAPATQITKILMGYEELTLQMASKNCIHSDLAKRIETRVSFTIECKEELARYAVNRKSFKDRLFSQDAQMRESFIETLNFELDNYAKSGDSKAIITLIQDRKESFEGFKLRSILNRFLVELNEFDRTIPPDYESKFDTIAVVNHELALAYLHEINNPELTELMNKLYEEISKLNHFGDTILNSFEDQGKVAKNLATALQAKADRFIIENKDEFNKVELPLEKRQFFLDFYADFRCHIHSKDEVMSQHTSWFPLVANIGLAALAILSFGIAIPVKQIVTELITGKSAFFCRTDGLDCVDNIEEVVSKNMAASAA